MGTHVDDEDIKGAIISVVSDLDPRLSLNLSQLLARVNRHLKSLDIFLKDAPSTTRERVKAIASILQENKQIQMVNNGTEDRPRWEIKKIVRKTVPINKSIAKELTDGTHFGVLVRSETVRDNLPWKGICRLANITDMKFWDIQYIVKGQNETILYVDKEDEMVGYTNIEFPLEFKQRVPEYFQIEITYFDGHISRSQNEKVERKNFIRRLSK